MGNPIRPSRYSSSDKAIGTERDSPDGDGEDSRRGARGGDRKEREFLQLPWTAGKGYPPLSEKWLDQGMDPTQPHGQVENVTAPSAGGFPNLVGKDRWQNKLVVGVAIGIGIGIEGMREGIGT